MTNESAAYKLAFSPIVFKQLAIDAGINQGVIASACGVKRPTINLALNRGYIPSTVPDFREKAEALVAGDPKAMQWLIARNMDIQDIWAPLGRQMRNAQPAGTRLKAATTRRNGRRPVVPGDPERLTIEWEVEMITQEAMKFFRIFRNPFIDDIQKESDIYMSDEHRYIEAAMIDAARHGGFLAVIGEVGSGKSVMRRKVVEQLKKDGDTIVIFPQMIDKTRVNAGSICDAIIMDLSEQKPRIKQEQKTRQVHQLLLERAKQGFRSVLIIEEAHDLHMNTLKYLKRFYELEDGFRKLLGIILIGQVELKNLFNEGTHIEMREVIRRIQTAEIRGLNGNIKDYLHLKFKRVGARAEDIFTDEAVQALSRRLTTSDKHNKIISHAYPLIVNNYAARAMNMAHEMGYEKVTEEVIEAI